MQKYMDIDMVSSSDELAELQENERLELKEKIHEQFHSHVAYNPLDDMTIGTFFNWNNDKVSAFHNKYSKVDRQSIQYLEQYE